MSRKAGPPAVILEGRNLSVAIPATMWAEMLLHLSKRSWRPDCPVHWFLADAFEVSPQRAAELGSAIRALLDAGLADPLAVYPVTFDMGRLAEIEILCEDGAFVVRHPAGKHATKASPHE